MKCLFSTTLSATLAATALVLAAPLAAQDAESNTEEEFEFQTEEEEALEAFEQEMNEAFAIFGDFFQADPLTPEQEARLPMAEKMANIIMPEGTFGLVMKDSMEPMMNAIMGAVGDNPRIRLSAITGVDAGDLDAVDDEGAQEALDIFDPQFAARNDRTGELVVEIVSDMFDALEPAYRDAYARALTTRFEETEMEELLAFFDTSTGGKFAIASFLIQYDPQMLGVMEQMGPAMIEIMPNMMQGFASLDEDFAKERKFSELSQAERERAATLLGKSVIELDALEPQSEEELEPSDASEYEEA